MQFGVPCFLCQVWFWSFTARAPLFLLNRTFQSLQHHDPSWGIDGSKPELKKHILCCQNYSGGDSIQKGELQSVENADANPTQAESISVASAEAEKPKNEESHTGAGNSAPHPGEHSEEPIKEMKHFLQPLWYNIKSGWAGGTYDDAEKFCELKNQALCPKIACEYQNILSGIPFTCSLDSFFISLSLK